ncbi:hypothetical protein EV424DRAFT_1329118 [Suillus variegatus]|nr:hypothetical protein EV424DRAFT_1329118 [Suillus variegatus]
METPQIFHGDGRASENPADFLKSFNRAMRQQSITVSTNKLDAFGDYLGTSSQAEVWFKALPSADKVSWPTFVTAFEVRWPPVKIAEKTKAEYEKELLDHILQSMEVGKKTMLHDRECWSHVAWAAKTLQLATSTGIAQSTLMIWQVRGTLPDIVKDLLKDEDYTNWAEFTKAVTDLKGSRLVEKQEQYNRQVQELNALRMDFARIRQRAPAANPIDALQNQLSRMSVSTPTLPTALPTTSTYARAPIAQTGQNMQPTHSRQPATAAAPQQPIIVTDELKAKVRLLITSFPHHPDTPAGHTAHAAQIAQWNGKWGDNARVTHETGYPLKPGMATICSGECFACGTHGHNSRNCVLPPGDTARLERKEAAWRAVSSRVLGAFNRFAATPISLVYAYDGGQFGEGEQEQGKGDGSV